MVEKKRLSIESLDEILDQMITTVETSKNDIFFIQEQSRASYQQFIYELDLMRDEISGIIDEEEKLHKILKEARLRLSHVSANFNKYSESEIKRAYEQTSELQVAHASLIEREKQIQKRRNELEIRLVQLSKTVERSEALITQVSVVLDYLTYDVKNLNTEMEAAKRKQEFGIRLLEAQEEERKRLSREIHDGPAQMLAHVMMRADLIERIFNERSKEEAVSEIRELRVSVQRALHEVRRIIYDIRPMALDDLGIVPTIRKYINERNNFSDVEIDYKVYGESSRLSPKLEIAVFRIVQEGLNNIVKHSKAKKAEVKLEIGANVSILIKDDGVGFNKDATHENSYGLIGMKERVDIFDGEMQIQSSKGKGTIIFIKIPQQDEPIKNKG